MLLATASCAGAGLGVQLTVADAGRPLTAQVGLVAGLGPLLVQVNVPFTGEPAGELVGNPLNVAAISANGLTPNS